MPVKDGIVGPIPEGRDPDEYDRLRRRVLWTMPSGLYVIGARDGERRNAMTANLVTQVSTDPKWLGVAVETDALTHQLIDAGGAFALNLIDREDRAIIRKFTKPVEADLGAMTLNGFAFHDAPGTGAPVLDQAVAFVDCEVRERVATPSHTFFLAEVVDAGFQKDEDTPVLRMEDTRMNYGG
ncbi:MAG TPA: flavin reductase family protein [Acidimicrobiia bacterium]|nr:flavin reductase family protein [Acidimicrobiia bacterium]